MPVLILAAARDFHARVVEARIARLGGSSILLDPLDLRNGPSLTATLGPGGGQLWLRVGGRTIDFSQVRSVWWRSRLAVPDLPDLADAADRRFADVEWEGALAGLIQGARPLHVNDPVANLAAQCKPRQLRVAEELGLRVPATLVTNDPHQVRAFRESHPRLVYKRVGSGPEALPTQDFTPERAAHLDALATAPVLFQERIDAAFDIRATVVGKEVFAAAIHSQEGRAPLDWRLDYGVPVTPHVLPPDLAERLVAYTRQLGLEYGAIDLRLTPKGEYVFLEINPEGQFMFVELLAGLPISEALAALLLSAEK